MVRQVPENKTMKAIGVFLKWLGSGKFSLGAVQVLFIAIKWRTRLISVGNCSIIVPFGKAGKPQLNGRNYGQSND